RVPQHMLEKLQKATNFKRDHMQEHGYEPTIRQIAEHVEMTPQDYANLVARTNTHRSLDSLAKEDGSPLIDLLPDESEANLLMVEASKEEVFEQLQLAFFRLTDRERNVVSACYGLDGKEPKTRAELGREQSVSRESIRQLEAKGINKLKIELSKYRGQRLAA
ncbi:MAG: sigma-70 domain-containing protein, partial [Coraliomargarita sp.]